MKKLFATLILLWSALFAQAQYIEDIRSVYTYPFHTRDFSIGIDELGTVRYVTICGEKVLAGEGCPVAIAFKDGKAFSSSFFECNFGMATIGFKGEVDNISLSCAPVPNMPQPHRKCGRSHRCGARARLGLRHAGSQHENQRRISSKLHPTSQPDAAL